MLDYFCHFEYSNFYYKKSNKNEKFIAHWEKIQYTEKMIQKNLQKENFEKLKLKSLEDI